MLPQVQSAYLEPRYPVYDLLVDATRPSHAVSSIQTALQRAQMAQRSSVIMDEEAMAAVNMPSCMTCTGCTDALEGLAHPPSSLCIALGAAVQTMALNRFVS